MDYDEIMALQIDFKNHKSFPKLSAPKVLKEKYPTSDSKPCKPPTGLPPYLTHCYKIPLLSKQQEVYLFRRMNYCKWLIVNLRDGLRPVDEIRIDAINVLLKEIKKTQDLIVESNLRLVVSFAKKFGRQDLTRIAELISNGNLALMRAVRNFDFGKGWKFSTFASWVITNQIKGDWRVRSRYEKHYAKQLFLDDIEDTNFDLEAGIRHEENRDQICTLFSFLSPREQDMLRRRYGMGCDPEKLQEVADHYNLTRERVRQITDVAIYKMRTNHAAQSR